MDNDERIRSVQQTLVVFGRIGELLNSTLVAAAGEAFATNGIVATLLHLDVRGPTRPGQLMDLTGLSSSGVSRLLERLEEAGLVVRRYGQLADDRRGTVVELTAKGRRMSRKMAESVMTVMDDVKVMLKEIDQIGQG